MTVIPIRRTAPVPITPTASVVQLPTAVQPDQQPRTDSRRARAYPPRQPRNGHHADCPYAGQGDVEHCGICQGLRKGHDHDQTA